ncbi:MAG: UDP-glucose/GDP-mannose dehydrogenase family protein [Betaproteobacteria bacterium]|nr:UDP-glucose/GDP-mannose dehydrogenase family protein [Betaproteobacteria bacterium]
MNITVVGTGYVGLVTGACLADTGNHVFCLDVDAAKIAKLNAGGLPIFEPGLDAVVARNRAAGRLVFSTDVEAGVAHGVLQFIAVGTPPGEDGSADLSHVLAAARSIGRNMGDYRVVVNKSTVPVGTADEVRAALGEELANRNLRIGYSVVSNPEFLKEGAAIEDFMRPDRIVIGSDDEHASALLRQLYAPFQRNHERILHMSVRSAELTKYAANAMLATRISFMNDLAMLAERLGADIEEVRRGIGSDPRIGFHFLYPGAGFGGSCFPKDVKALQRTAESSGRPLRVLAAVEQVNEAQKHVLGEKVRARFGEDLQGRRFAVWGLAFKPNTDDMREAASRTLIEDLLAAGAAVRAFDPVAGEEARRLYAGEKRVEIVNSAQAALAGAEALVIVTEWLEFRSPDFAAIKRELGTAAIFDGRNLYDPATLKEMGFEYFPIGRRT